MSRRIDIELTSALADGSWTWRAAGARKPNGVLDGSILPAGAKVGDEIKVEMEQMLEGVEILSVVKGRQKSGDANVLEILPSSEPFEAVIETRARRSRTEGKSGDRDRPRRDNRRDDRKRDDRGPQDRKGDDRKGDDRKADDRRRDDRSRDDRRPGRDARPGDERRERAPRRDRPHFEAPPELPQRPKPKRLRPGKARRNAVLADIPEEQRPIAELASQGLAAVRTRVKEENAKLETSGQPTMPEASVLKMAEELLPKLRVADWLDRAEAAQRQMDHLDLRDLRSVIAAGDDSTIARDETARALNIELKAQLVRRQEEELHLWIGDIDAALGVGRVIRALRLSSQPPKAGVMFPPELARRLGEAAGQSLQPTDSADRWIAVLEAAAFSPVRSLVVPAAPPETITDDLRSTVVRLGPALPQIAALLVVEVPAGTAQPKPLRPNPRQDAKRRPAKAAGAKPDPKPKATAPEAKRTASATEPAKTPESAEAASDPVRSADQVQASPEPVKAAEATEPAAEPAESVEPNETTEPAAKPAESVEPNETTEPSAKPAESVKANEATEPAANPAESGVPEDSVKPAESAEHASGPASPVEPEAASSRDAGSADQVKPAESGDPADPIEPAAQPAESVEPPAEPVKPVESAEPEAARDTPAEPEAGSVRAAEPVAPEGEPVQAAEPVAPEGEPVQAAQPVPPEGEPVQAAHPAGEIAARSTVERPEPGADSGTPVEPAPEPTAERSEAAAEPVAPTEPSPERAQAEAASGREDAAPGDDPAPPPR